MSNAIATRVRNKLQERETNREKKRDERFRDECVALERKARKSQTRT